MDLRDFSFMQMAPHDQSAFIEANLAAQLEALVRSLARKAARQHFAAEADPGRPGSDLPSAS